MQPREFAIEIVKTLQTAGHQALWAGGCVRDQLLNRIPKDYDIATSATPDQVRDVFGKRRTLPIGASFGVITVLGPKSAGPIEIATFRRDGGYSDGRRPDSVEFTDAREDALRRDFTINGMFYDPIAEQIIDYVGGQADLAKRQIRAIGNPHERIEEDKLRMLRGVRFASTYDFELEATTLAAIVSHASELTVVSGERIGAEMRRMLAGPNRAVAVRLLKLSGLLAVSLEQGTELGPVASDWGRTLACLERLKLNDFAAAVTILLEPIVVADGIGGLFERWKLSNDEKKSIVWVCKNWRALSQADRLPWSEVQPILLKPDIERALAVVESQSDSPSGAVGFCRERLAWERERLDPRPLLNGGDLIRLGIKKGPAFKLVLEAVRNAQLDGEIDSVEQAEAIALGWGS
ncbi:MAG: tRNA nucleotidyltransferase/poly(A) polymerase [Mariniblastus sp.]|jgi:tRNA nucleotidyltransferase/poly(A) polymerase